MHLQTLFFTYPIRSKIIGAVCFQREQAAAMDSFKDDFDKRKAEWTKQVGNINQQRMAADERMRQMMQEGFENNQKGLLEANNKLNELNTELDDINEKFGDTLVQLYEQDKTLLNLTEMNTRIRAQQDVSLFQQTSIILHLADLTARTADSEKHILKILAVTFVKEYIKEDLEVVILIHRIYHSSEIQHPQNVSCVVRSG